MVQYHIAYYMPVLKHSDQLLVGFCDTISKILITMIIFPITWIKQSLPELAIIESFKSRIIEAIASLVSLSARLLIFHHLIGLSELRVIRSRVDRFPPSNWK